MPKNLPDTECAAPETTLRPTAEDMNRALRAAPPGRLPPELSDWLNTLYPELREGVAPDLPRSGGR
ncbi:hypothetical protein ABT024_05100 [Streptomyces sp. NPDC002812]|uniref:hypothetical protein n=1 Tax=Streptomyces sp. NPDC002812 TaxID=3154434 RepID=UPI00333409D4